MGIASRRPVAGGKDASNYHGERPVEHGEHQIGVRLGERHGGFDLQDVMIGTSAAQENAGIAGALNGRGEHLRCGFSRFAVRDKLNAEKETLTPDVAYHFMASTKFLEAGQ